MRILVVEDEIKMARAIVRGLENEGYAAEMVHDGDDAVFWATEQEFDAIILDVMLPGRDGFTVCRDLRAKAVQTPVLMLTARGSVEDRIGGLDAGADDYLVKLRIGQYRHACSPRLARGRCRHNLPAQGTRVLR